ncbi:hypothetical protein GC174_08675 [bacterium]|nr:hypothetical protein [bacterium]
MKPLHPENQSNQPLEIRSYETAGSALLADSYGSSTERAAITAFLPDRASRSIEHLPQFPRVEIDSNGTNESESYGTANFLNRIESLGIKDAKLDRFADLASAFEMRADSSALPSSEVNGTYDNITRLLEASQTKIPSLDKARVAEEILINAAHPETIGQGMRQTCGVASLENRLYRNNPSEAAALVADMAISGSHIDALGVEIKMSPRLFTTDQDSRYLGDGDGNRNYANQIFQSAAIETWLNGSTYRYQIERSGEAGNVETEYLINDATGEKEAFSGMTLLDMSYIEFRLTGKTDRKTYLGHNEIYRTDPTGLINRFDSVESLQNKLEELHSSNSFPASIFVRGGEGLSTGPHFVTIVNYDPGSKKVEIDNSTSSFTDRLGEKALNLEDLYRISHEKYERPPLRQAPPEENTANDDGSYG